MLRPPSRVLQMRQLNRDHGSGGESPTSGIWAGLLPRPLSRVCRWPSSPFVLTGSSFCVSVLFSLLFYEDTSHWSRVQPTASFLLDQTILHPVPCCSAGAQGFHIKIGGGNTIQPITPRIKYSFYFPQSLYHSQHGLKFSPAKELC